MSGFEVAGVVLGSIPIVVSALQFYIKGLGTMGRWRRFTLELESLILKLSTEEAKLQNVYEKLLRDIVPDDQIEPMLKDPLGPLWKEAKVVSRIRQRLWRHLNVFEENVRRMNDAMEEMKEKLGIGSDGKVRWIEASGMKKQFKRVMFILQQDEYGMLTKRLRESVSSLEEIVSGNMELEPARCRRSQMTWYRLLRDLSGSVYQALQSSMTKCVCPGFHDFGLRLLSQPSILTPHDDDEEVVKSQKFNLILSFTSTLAHDTWATSKLWNLLSLSVGTSKCAPATGARVRFALPTPPPTEIPGTSGMNGFGDTTQISPSGSQPISNLCHAVRRSRKQAAKECCGQISDGSPKGRIYDVYPLGSPNDSDDWSPVSLGAALSEDAALAGLTCIERLRLAWIITAGVLQLEETPWLPGTLSKDEIFLAQHNGAILSEDVFVMKRLPERSSAAMFASVSNRNSTSSPSQIAMFNASSPRDAETIKAHGILLVELIFGQTIDRLQAMLGSHNALMFTPRAPPSHYETVLCLIDQINTRVGANYCSAVKRCMNGVGFGDMAGNDVLIGVLSLLEQDLRHVMG